MCEGERESVRGRGEEETQRGREGGENEVKTKSDNVTMKEGSFIKIPMFTALYIQLWSTALCETSTSTNPQRIWYS